MKPKKSSHPNTTRFSEAGYGKPPVAHQFSKGKSGNPKGRPKSTANSHDLLKALLQSKIPIKSNDRLIKVNVKEAVLRKLVNDALHGKPHAMRELLNRIESLEPAPLPVHEEVSTEQLMAKLFRNSSLRKPPEDKS